jgi:hypothetical protein
MVGSNTLSPLHYSIGCLTLNALFMVVLKKTKKSKYRNLSIDLFSKIGYFIDSLAISKFLTRREMFLMAATYMVVWS